MGDHDSLIHAYLLDGKGGGKAVDEDDIEGWDPNQGLLWIHLDSKHPDTRDWLENKSALNTLTSDSLLEQETRPRNMLTDDGLVLIL